MKVCKPFAALDQNHSSRRGTYVNRIYFMKCRYYCETIIIYLYSPLIILPYITLKFLSYARFFGSSIISDLNLYSKFGGGQNIPTLYEYYTDGGIHSGLEAPVSGFKLNGKDITIFSGAIHYFRVHPKYWRDRLRKLRAAGLNTVETYIPWNLHEPEKGIFDFGNGSNDFSFFLDIRAFIQMAQEEDLFVIIRPGPYICSEWDFGGLPSWLLGIPGIKVRTSDTLFTSRVKIYFDRLLPHVVDLQFSKGGSIIAVQIENEYGAFGKLSDPRDKEYLKFIKNTYQDNGLEGLFVTSDTPATSGDIGSLPDVLQTANFNSDPIYQLDALKRLQPSRALMVMEFWSGWFDHWIEGIHQTGLTEKVFEDYLEKIFNHNSSVNVYMFHGGTNFGFMNGANSIPFFPNYAPDVSSYDYDAPLSEAGDYTEKYRILEKVIAKYNKVITKLPNKPEESKKSVYLPVHFIQYLNMNDILEKIDNEEKVIVDNVISMENLNINNGNGQSYGYINYRKKVSLSTYSSLTIVGHVRDTAMLLLDGEQKTKKITGKVDLAGFGYWANSDQEFAFDESDAGEHILDILVENWGRINYGNPEDFNQFKGLREGPVIIDEMEQYGWEITSLQFKSEWINRLDGWKTGENVVSKKGPILLRGTFEVEDEPADTWLDMSDWGKGVIFINGFNIGRYLYLGPPTTLYVPAPLLQTGPNEIIIFEHYSPAEELKFRNSPVLAS